MTDWKGIGSIFMAGVAAEVIEVKREFASLQVRFRTELGVGFPLPAAKFFGGSRDSKCGASGARGAYPA